MNTTTTPIAVQSRKMLVEALLALMQEKPYQDISICELTERATLSRRTFYRLFDAIDEILLYQNNLVSIVLNFVNTISQEIYHRQKGDRTLAKNPEALEYALSYSSGGIVNIIFTWASKGMDKTPEELMRLLRLALV